jgi:hypothetical protein
MKAVPLDDQSGFFDIEAAEEFEPGEGMGGEGVLYRTDKGHFVRYFEGQNRPLPDDQAFFWLLRNGHQDAAQKYLPGFWEGKQV